MYNATNLLFSATNNTSSCHSHVMAILI